MIKQFDKAICRRLGDEILEALRPLATKYGLALQGKGGSFDPLAFTARVEFGVTQTASGKSRDEAEFEKYCALFHLTPADYGRTFAAQDGTYRLLGFELRRRKFPVRAQHVTTGTVRLFQETVLTRLNPLPESP